MEEKRFIVLVVGFVVSALAFSRIPGQEEWAEANRKVLRLEAASFPQLPDPVKEYLTRNGFKIPQASDLKEPHNVIRGRFMRAGRLDWAVLASKDLQSAVLIFPGGSTDDVIQLARNDDRNYLQVFSSGVIGFSRRISTVDTGYILAHYERYGGPKPPRIDHEGINDVFIGKGSVIHYFYGGRWFALTGAD